VGEVLWTTTSACTSVPRSSRVRPLIPESPPILGAPCLKKERKKGLRRTDRCRQTNSLDHVSGVSRARKNLRMQVHMHPQNLGDRI
jgi:hypothetical protein